MVAGSSEGSASGQRYRDLVAWQVSFKLGYEVYRITASWPKHEIYGLTSQIRRAAVSVSANIAEGYERRGKTEFARYLDIARGSLGEVETYLLFALELGYIDKSDYARLDALRIRSAKLIGGLLSSLKSSKRPAK